MKGKENITLDGKKIMLYANIGNMQRPGHSSCRMMPAVSDCFAANSFTSRKIQFPTEEEQFQIYRTVAETMAGKRVIIRTLDIGADKQCDYFEMAKEENPAMGCRAIRICLTRPEIFKTQLKGAAACQCVMERLRLCIR